MIFVHVSLPRNPQIPFARQLEKKIGLWSAQHAGHMDIKGKCHFTGKVTCDIGVTCTHRNLPLISEPSVNH